MWNTEIALSKMASTNFRADSKIIRVAKPDTSNVDNLNDEDDFLSNLKLNDSAEKSKIKPNPELVQTLYNMGFPLELAKKALILTKNKGGISAALD